MSATDRLLRLKKEQEKLRYQYRKVFAGTDGEAVLADLMQQFGHVNENTPPLNATAAGWQMGRLAVMHYLKDMVRDDGTSTTD